ncbi:hypothetical protein CYMTET_9931 [Cymbomonas tetramitiformis]|uniref:CxC5 like cysteine cluster associated with KDZ domain-containing protein n=1 Tax=Cymbomonas tetramitiformis TaxID=36881 RepID=A0AAE0GQ44_9CHLO|nr:hypothetical protein CYMTET_9931 [Cymbomonas tetramitiformis]
MDKPPQKDAKKAAKAEIALPVAIKLAKLDISVRGLTSLPNTDVFSKTYPKATSGDDYIPCKSVLASFYDKARAAAQALVVAKKLDDKTLELPKALNGNVNRANQDMKNFLSNNGKRLVLCKIQRNPEYVLLGGVVLGRPSMVGSTSGLSVVSKGAGKARRPVNIIDDNVGYVGVERRKRCANPDCKATHYLNYVVFQDGGVRKCQYYGDQWQGLAYLKVSAKVYLTTSMVRKVQHQVYAFHSGFRGVAQCWNVSYGVGSKLLDARGRDLELGYKLFNLALREGNR